MKKGCLLNSNISSIVAKLGHTNRITIGDAGLPIPDECERIDLALTKGIPTFMETLSTVSSEMQVEHVILATEIKLHNEAIHHAILNEIRLLEQMQKNKITIEYLSHALFKEETKQSKAVIRTGECSPYANIILVSGVTF